jgi:hypothetical protein
LLAAIALPAFQKNSQESTQTPSVADRLLTIVASYTALNPMLFEKTTESCKASNASIDFIQLNEN